MTPARLHIVDPPSFSVPVVDAPPPITIRAAGPGDLVHWPFIREGLLKIKERQGHDSTWTPAHVRAALLAMPPRAELWLAFSGETSITGETPIAFTITQEMVDPFLSVATSMFVWFAYRDPRASASVVGLFDEFLTKVSKDRGYEYLEAYTTRRGLGKRMARHGWSTIMYVLRRKVW